MLRFTDGTSGFIMLHGEPCYFNIVAGDIHLDFSDDRVSTYLPNK